MAKYNSNKGEEEMIEDHNMEAMSLVKQTYTENFYSTFVILYLDFTEKEH